MGDLVYCRSLWKVLIFQPSSKVEKPLSKIAFVAGTIKIILPKWLTPENRERFSLDKFRACKHKNVSDNKKKSGEPNI